MATFRRVFMSFALALCAWPAAAQQPSIRPLTEQDIAEIRQLSAKYARALGTCAGADYAAVFTPDGSYSSSEFTGAKHRELFGAHGGRAVGRARLIELVMTEPFCVDPNGNRTPRNPPDVVIRPSPEGARGIATMAAGNRYEDVYVRTQDGWRIKSRSHVRPGQFAYSEVSEIPSTLTPQDEAEIRQLSVTYATSLGLCDARGYASVFTADGFYSSSEFTGARHREMYGPNGGRIPRSDMTPFVMSEPQCTDPKTPKTPREAPATINPRSTRDGAAASIPLANGARYEDVYVKTPDGWRIKSREHVRAGQEAFSKRLVSE